MLWWWAVEEYPATLAELESTFGTEQACRDYLLKLRWPEGLSVHAAVGARLGRLTATCWSASAANTKRR